MGVAAPRFMVPTVWRRLLGIGRPIRLRGVRPVSGRLRARSRSTGAPLRAATAAATPTAQLSLQRAHLFG